MRDAESSAPPEKLLEWVRGCETVGCIRIEARHLAAASEGGSPVSTFEIRDTGDAGGERFDAPAIFRRLEEDAESIGGVQRYTLLAFREGSKAPRERLTLRVDGGTDEGGSATEPANATGLVAQAHRHNEALMGMVVRMCGTALETVTKQNQKLLEEVEKAREERVETWAILAEVSKHQGEREAAKHALVLKEKQADVMRDGLKLVMPALVAKVTGALGAPPSREVQETAFVRFVESLTQEQQAAVFQLLTPEQQIALGAALDTFVKKEAQQASSKGESA